MRGHRSRRCRSGPTDGHDRGPISELVEKVIYLEWRIGRTRADLRGEAYGRGAEATRDRRSLAVCEMHAGHVSTMAARINVVIVNPAAKGIHRPTGPSRRR